MTPYHPDPAINAEVAADAHERPATAGGPMTTPTLPEQPVAGTVVPRSEMWRFIEAETAAGRIVVVGPPTMTPGAIKAHTMLAFLVGKAAGEPDISIAVEKPEATR
jgi:hypothetical protein